MINELQIGDPQAFFNFHRMEPAMFDKLVQTVGPRITKTDTHMRKALSPGLKIAMTVRYLASGDKYPSLMYSFRVARNTICLLIPKVCEAIVEEYIDEVLQCPANPEEWNKVEEVLRKKKEYSSCCRGYRRKNLLLSENQPKAVPCITITRDSFVWSLWL